MKVEIVGEDLEVYNEKMIVYGAKEIDCSKKLLIEQSVSQNNRLLIFIFFCVRYDTEMNSFYLGTYFMTQRINIHQLITVIYTLSDFL